MNNRRRDSLRNAISYLEKASDIISNAADEERDCYDNMPENLLDSDRCVAMETAADCLDDAIDSIDTAIDAINEAISQ